MGLKVIYDLHIIVIIMLMFEKDLSLITKHFSLDFGQIPWILYRISIVRQSYMLQRVLDLRNLDSSLVWL